MHFQSEHNLCSYIDQIGLNLPYHYFEVCNLSIGMAKYDMLHPQVVKVEFAHLQ